MYYPKQPKIPEYSSDEIEEVILPDLHSGDIASASSANSVRDENNDDKKIQQTEKLPAVDESSKPAAVSEKGKGKKEHIYADMFVAYFAAFGELFCDVILKCLSTPFEWLIFFLLFIWKHTFVFRKTIADIAKTLFNFVAGPFLRTKRALGITGKKIKQAKEIGDRQQAFKLYMRVVKEALFGRRGLAVTLFNYAAPIIAITFLMSVVGYATKTNYAIKLSVNGKFVGYIQNEQVFTDAEQIMKERITYVNSDESAISMTPEYSLEMLGDQEYMTKYQLANKMLEISDTPIEYAYGFYIGDKFYGALLDKTRVEAELEKILDSYRTGSEDEDVAFEKEISYVSGLYLSDSIVDEEPIIELINSKKVEASYYTVVENDSPSAISDKLGISIEKLKELNPEIADEDYVFVVGDKLVKTQEVPFLSVSISRTEVYDVDVPFDTEHTTDDEHYQGVYTTIQKGENGANRITAKVYCVNGEEVRRTILSTERVKDPVTEIVSEGTLAPQSSHYSSDTAEYDKKYIFPVQNGRLVEWGWWDGGYYGHTGVDLFASYGNDVYAGASGTVTYAGWDNGGYGNLVMITHPDGYTTLYAHNSEIYVYVGQEVVQGQCIAAIGETGRAYGPHCHFEVRWGSERLNPRYYLSGLPDLGY